MDENRVRMKYSYYSSQLCALIHEEIKILAFVCPTDRRGLTNGVTLRYVKATRKQQHCWVSKRPTAIKCFYKYSSKDIMPEKYKKKIICVIKLSISEDFDTELFRIFHI